MSIRFASLFLALLAFAPLIARAQTPTTAAPPTASPPPAQTPAVPSEVTPAAPAPAEPAPVAATPEPVTPVPAPELAPPTSPAPVATPEPAAAPAEVEPEFPKKLAVGTSGWFTPGLLLQGWYQVDHADDTTDTFRIRRAEISAKGDIIPGLVGYAVMIDPAKALEFKDIPIAIGGETTNVKQPPGSTSIFQDFFITYQSKYLDASIGQFKIPVSYEGYTSSSKLLFAERAAVSRAYGDRRDIGLRLAKTFEYIGYSAGIFNGAGQNNLDGNTGKDLGLRLEVYPIKGLLIGGVVYSSVGQRDEAGAKDRFEADLRFEKDGFLFQSEFIHANDVGSNGNDIPGNGFYAQVAYAFLEQTLQPAFRVGYLDPDANRNLNPAMAGGMDEQFHFDFGLTYYVRKQEAKLLLNYYRIEYQDKTENNQFIFAAQVSY